MTGSIRVISIWGMGGVGKTTIARKVYNHMKNTRNDRFAHFAWVCITQQCQTRSVLEEVVEQLDPQKMVKEARKIENPKNQRLSIRVLMDKLCEIQRTQRCLVVLDDLWKVSDWNEMKHAFLVEDLQSKILVTTRHRHVADAVGFSLELGLLQEVHALELLRRKSFPENNIPDSLKETIDKIGKEMVQKCGYLLLAISLLGAVLSKKNPLTEWEIVNKNISEYIYRANGQDEKENQIQGVISLSYEDLPYYLKPCFLYLGILKEDQRIYADELYTLWIAQGMISSEKIHANEETLMEIAESYLSELCSRCIVQVEVNYLLPTKKYTTCKLHDVVREVCLSIGKNENFRVQTLVYEGRSYITSLQKKTHYLAIRYKGEAHGDGDELTINSEEDTRKHIRSLQIVSDVFRNAIRFPPQKVIDFKTYRMLRDLVIIRF